MPVLREAGLQGWADQLQQRASGDCCRATRRPMCLLGAGLRQCPLSMPLLILILLLLLLPFTCLLEWQIGGWLLFLGLLQGCCGGTGSGGGRRVLNGCLQPLAFPQALTRFLSLSFCLPHC